GVRGHCECRHGRWVVNGGRGRRRLGVRSGSGGTRAEECFQGRSAAGKKTHVYRCPNEYVRTWSVHALHSKPSKTFVFVAVSSQDDDTESHSSVLQVEKVAFHVLARSPA